MTHICDNYYFDSDGSQYILYWCERREILSLGKKEPTGKFKDCQDTIGYYLTLHEMLKGCIRHATKLAVKNGVIENINECMDYITVLEEKILDATRGN